MKRGSPEHVTLLAQREAAELEATLARGTATWQAQVLTLLDRIAVAVEGPRP